MFAHRVQKVYHLVMSALRTNLHPGTATHQVVWTSAGGEKVVIVKGTYAACKKYKRDVQSKDYIIKPL
jgi:hypothetical protein